MMKKQRLWAYSLGSTAAFCLLVFPGLSVAEPADAQISLPSSPAKVEFSFWKKMHASSYEGTINSALSQCYKSVFTANTWLTSDKCQLLGTLLENNQCMEILVPDGIRLDLLNGRVNGDPKGESKTWRNQEKQTGRLDSAVWCDLDNGVHAYWFTGDVGRSCNNVGFVYHPPEPEPIPPAKLVVVPPERFMRHTGVVGSDSIQVLSPPPSNCCACSTNYGQAIIINNGGDLQSTGQSKVDW